MTKELYEPLWDDIYLRSRKLGFSVRGIWIADVAHQGMSSVLNEDKLSNDPSWNDHSRDLLHMINHFREQMPRPLVGIGHSFGGCQLVNLSLMHPRLLTTLILIDPVIHTGAAMGPPDDNKNIAYASTFRRDLWPSRQAAETSFRGSPFYRTWDPRVLDRWIKYGIRALPTRIHPDKSKEGSADNPVTLTTTKHQEVWTFLRPNFAGTNVEGKPVYDRSSHADLDQANSTYPFYRPEPAVAFRNLPFLRPSVLYIFGGKSSMANPEWRKEKLRITGIGTGGSGGAKEGRVKEILFEEVGHLVAMEVVTDTAEASAQWLDQEMRRWRQAEYSYRELRSKRSAADDIIVSEEWIEKIGGRPPARKSGLPTKL